MKSLIKACSRNHATIYTLHDECPRCGGSTRNTAPPPFSPEDPYGEYRRRTKWKK